ncbi:allene oxide cyclase barrel-like domain-containing protein [Streptomyces litchfieldiae]|uniref:Allene oxide cyclase barrel-like domain-containing protein n=1 Tax=Streptomyces litchfieldiae TaxID=3075543 RepID=A0ABU2MQJ2_9ACTN|nr:hypothetical protein [Streptomyces sp. DSM 44938]MDT0343618.1 hypothetical protein [Streptomyces sp. DSM 44938]
MNIRKRRIRRAAVAVCATALTTLTVSGGGPPGGGPQPGDSGRDGRTIRVETNLRVSEELDLGASGRSVGDQFIFSGDLLSVEDSDGSTVGTIGGYCVITEVERNAGQCSLTAVLDGGQITVQGEQEGIPTPSAVTNAITGGTGEFRNAQGEMALEFQTPVVWRLTFTLTGR